MKKIFFLQLLIVLLVVSCTSKRTVFLNNYKNDLESLKLKGKVKLIKTYHLQTSDDLIFSYSKDLSDYEIEKFNKNGQYTSKTTYHSNGKIEDEKIYYYDKYGNQIDKSMDSNYIIKYQYNKKGCIIKREDFSLDKSNFHRTLNFKLDNKCRILETSFIQNDTLDVKYQFKYKNNECIYETKYLRYGSYQIINRKYDNNLLIREDFTIKNIQTPIIKYSNTYFYNKKGKLIKEKLYFENDSIYNENIYVYDKKHNLIKTSGIQKEQIRTIKWSQKFNQYGDVIESYSELLKFLSYKNSYLNDDGTFLGQKWIYKYNKDGSLNSNSEILAKSKYDGVWIYKYKYDNHNNWIEKKSFKDEILKYVTYRTIAYY